MDKIKKSHLSFLASFTTGILIGILIGAAILNILVSYRIDEYIKEIQLLQSTIEDKNSKLDKLEKSINKNKFILKDIKVFLISNEEELDKIILEKHIREKYISILGKEVKNIDIEILGNIIDNRIMKIDKKEYKLKIDKIMLTDILNIWVEVTIIE